MEIKTITGECQAAQITPGGYNSQDVINMGINMKTREYIYLAGRNAWRINPTRPSSRGSDDVTRGHEVWPFAIIFLRMPSVF